MRIFFSVAAVIAALLTPQAAAQPGAGQTPIAEIPYRIDYQGWITVETMVNGSGPYDFIVDSGATITAVFQNLADRHPFEPANREPIQIIGLIGADRLPAYIIGGIEYVGGAGGPNIADHVGVILPDWAPLNKTPQGIIGLDFLTRYTVLFDAERKVIALYPRDAKMNETSKGWSGTRLRAKNVGDNGSPSALYSASVVIRRKSIPCIVDLGASGTIFNVPAFRHMTAGIYIDGDRRGGFSTGSRINDVFDNREQAHLVRIDRLSIGNKRWRNGLYLVYDAEIFDKLGVARRPFCLLGADVLASHSFMFDFANETLYIGPEA